VWLFGAAIGCSAHEDANHLSGFLRAKGLD